MSLFEHKQTDHALQKYDKSLDPPEELKTDRPVCLPVPFVDDRDAKNLRESTDIATSRPYQGSSLISTLGLLNSPD